MKKDVPVLKSSNIDFTSRVMDYINNNWADADLNLSKISMIFGYVPPYISVLFYQRYNISIIEYINQKRIENVKRLLLETDMVLSQITKQTGFYSESSLIRVFKRYENMTPGTYRKNNK